MKGETDMAIRRVKLAVVLAAWLVAAWFVATSGGSARAADEAILSERRLPKNVLAFVSLRNCNDFKAQWSKTMFGQLERDESLADFRADVEKQLAESSKQIEDQIGLTLSDLVSIPHGEIAAAAIAGQGAKISVVLFMDYGDREEAVQKLLTKAAEAFENNGMKRSEEEIDDTNVVIYRKTSDEGDQKLAEGGSYFLKDSLLVMGSDLSVLKTVLSRWDGKHERVLADNDVYRYIVEKCRDENSDALPQLTWFIDPVALFQAGAASQPQVAAQMALVMGMLPTLGVDKFRGVGGTFDMAHGDYDMVSRTLLYLDRPAKGVVNLLQFDTSPQAPPKWLSADWTGYTAVNWNVAKAYSAVEGLVDMFQGPGTLAQMIQNLADNENTGGIHLKKDVIDQLTGRFQIAEDDTAPKPSAGGSFLVAAELKNVAAFRATLAKATRIPGLKFSERDFQGETVYEIAGWGGAADDEGGEGSAVQIGIAVVQNHLMVASDVRLLERVLRGVGDRETLADSAEFKRIARKYPAQTASIAFSRHDSQFKRIYEALKAGQAGPFLPELLQSLDFSKLPEIDSLKKYMPASGGFMERDERGLKFTNFSLRTETD
jgi:hypothetical protein